MSTAYWISHSSSNGTIWRRPLGIAETAFYWDGILGGSTDAMQHNEVDVENSHLDVMSPENIRQAWLAVKRRCPLLAAQIIRKEDNELFFEVTEERVLSISEGELTIGHINFQEEISTFNESFMGPRQLTPKQNVKVIVKSSPKSSHHWGTNHSRYHIWLMDSHSICDGTANLGLFAAFMTMLTTPSQRLTKESIGGRLSRTPDAETLHLNPAHSIARIRWRRAIAYALLEAREGHFKVCTRIVSNIVFTSFKPVGWSYVP
jgi:hypothetical protein